MKIGPDPLLSTAEAAAIVGVKATTIRQWVYRGHLDAERPPSVTRRYRMSAVLLCGEARMTPSQRQGYERAVTRWRAMLDIESQGCNTSS